MKQARFGALALLGYLVMGTPAKATITVDGVDAFAGATAVLVHGRRFSPDEETVDATLAPDQAFVDAAISATKQDAGGSRAFAHEDVFASFATTTSGTVNFSGISTSLSASATTTAEAYNSGSSFNYNFTLDSDYLFSVGYRYSETDNYYYDNYYQLINTAGGRPLFSDSPLSGTYDAPATGSQNIILNPGSYEFGVTTKLGDLSAVQGPDYGAGSHAEQYAFAITAVPELATWMYIIVGVGLIGMMLRKPRLAVVL